MKIYSIVIMIVCALVSCTEVMDDFSVRTAESRLVVDAHVSSFTQTATVRLSKTAPFLNSTDVAYVSGATVVLYYNETVLSLNEIDTIPGTYTAEAVFPENTEYRLEVRTTDALVTAKSYMPVSVRWDSTSVVIPDFAKFYTSEDSSRLYSVLAYMTDPGNQTNYYRVEGYKQDSVKFRSVTDDGYFGGQSVQLVTSVYVLKPHDTLTFYLKSIDKQAYEFFNTLETSNSSSSFFSAPDNPTSNLEGDALGLFYAYSADSVSIVIPED